MSSSGKGRSSSKKKKKKRNRIPITIMMQRRLAITIWLILLALFALIAALGIRIYFHGDEYSRKVLAQMGYDSQTIPYQRGNITDANGVILATNEVNYNLILDPSIITSSENITDPTIDALCSIFGYDRAELTARIMEDEDATYIRYDRGLSEEQRSAFAALQESVNTNVNIKDWIKGVWFETEYKRIYPYGSLASDLIGFSVGGGSVGMYGVEQYYNDELTGTNGRMYGYLNQDNLTEVHTIDAVDGYTIVTTLDTELQKILEENALTFWNTIGCENLAMLAMDVNTGAIKAAVNLPNYDLNDPYDLSARYTEAEIEAMTDKEYSDALNDLWSNYITSTIYEPGSTMKPFTVGAALEEGVVSTSDTFLCLGVYEVKDTKIQCAVYPDMHGELSLEQSITYSCNPCLIQISERMGARMLSSYQYFYGFGAKTGVDLPGEEAGLLIDADSMTAVDAATNSFGQNMDVTLVQLGAAYCSILNGGTYYQPHFVKQILTSNNKVVENIRPTVVRETLSSSTCDFLKKAMKTVLDHSSYWEDIPGYTLGGKTGTAEKYPRGNGNYIVSLASFEPYDNPDLLLIVVIDEPHVEDQSTGGYTMRLANATWRDIIEYKYGVDLDPEPETEAPAVETTETGEETPEAETDGTEETTETEEGGPQIVDYGESP